MKRLTFISTVLSGVVTYMAGSVVGDYITLKPSNFQVFARGELKIDNDANISGNVGGGSKVTLKRKGIFGSNIFSNGAFTAEQEIQVNGYIMSNGILYMKEKSTVLGAIYAGGVVTFDRLGSYGSITSGGNATFGNNTSVLGDVLSNGDVWIDPDSTINGDVVHGGTFGTGSNVTITGNVSSGSSNSTTWAPQYRDAPTLSTDETGSTHYGDNSEVTLDPGDYGNVEIDRKSTVRLSAGIYNFATFSLGNETKLLMDNTNGKIFINVVGDATFDKKVVFALLNDNSNDLIFQSGGKTKFGDNSVLQGHFRSFGNDMIIGKHTTISGSVYSDGKLTLKTDVSIIPAPPTLLAFAFIVGFVRRRRQ